MFERTDPKTLKLWLIVAAVVYLLLPYDLFPDFLGIPGRIDDVLMLAWLAWFYRNHVQQYAAAGSGHESAGGSAKEGFPNLREGDLSVSVRFRKLASSAGSWLCFP